MKFTVDVKTTYYSVATVDAESFDEAFDIVNDMIYEDAEQLVREDMGADYEIVTITSETGEKEECL